MLRGDTEEVSQVLRQVIPLKWAAGSPKSEKATKRAFLKGGSKNEESKNQRFKEAKGRRHRELQIGRNREEAILQAVRGKGQGSDYRPRQLRGQHRDKRCNQRRQRQWGQKSIAGDTRQARARSGLTARFRHCSTTEAATSKARQACSALNATSLGPP